MASDPIPPSRAVGFHSPESASLWSRLSTYVSENKVVAYTIGAVIVVAGAGGIYYVTQSSQVGGKGKTRKERRSDKSGKPVIKDPRPEGEKESRFFIFHSSPIGVFFGLAASQKDGLFRLSCPVENDV